MLYRRKDNLIFYCCLVVKRGTELQADMHETVLNKTSLYITSKYENPAFKLNVFLF